MKVSVLVTLLLFPGTGMAQTVSLGVIGGVPLTEAFETANFNGLLGGNSAEISYTSRAKRYTVGPAVEVSLPFGMALEVDLLYKRLNYNSVSSVTSPFLHGINEQRNIISRWELPALLKYRVPKFASLTPYFSAGLNTNYIVNTTQISRAGAVPSLGALLTLGPPIKSRNPPAELRYRSAEGIVVAGGLGFRVHRIRATSELRYTRWTHENFREPFPAGKLRSNLDQAEVLFTLGLP